MRIAKLAMKAFQAAYGSEQPATESLPAIFHLVRFGYIDNAREALPQISRRHGGAYTEWLEDICGRVEIYSRPKLKLPDGTESVSFEGVPEPVTVRPPTDVMIIRAPEAEHLLISFGGLNSAFWVPKPVLDLPRTSVIALRDDRRLWHLAGIRGLGGNFKQSVEELQRLIKALGFERVVLAGCSSGGYAALRYGLELEARGVLAISPVTGHEDIPAQVARFPATRKVAATVPDLWVDVLPLYQRHPNPPKLIIAFGENHEFDAGQAMRMKELPNVTLEPVHGVAAHASWLQLGTDKKLEPLLKRLLAF